MYKTHNDVFFCCNLWAYYSHILNKIRDFFEEKNSILIILVDFYDSLSRFCLLPGSGSTFPKVDPDTDPKHCFTENPLTKISGMQG